MMNINQFTARATDEVPPRVAIEFAPGNSFQKDGIPCTNLAVRGHRQITVHLGNKKVMNEAAGDLASATDCGKVLTVWPDGQNTYTYVSDNEASERVSLSQVTLQLRGTSLVAKFEAGGAGAPGPAVPGMPAPAPTQAVAAAPAVPAYGRLMGCLSEESFKRIKALANSTYSDYQWYVNNPNTPNSEEEKAAYYLLYPLFLGAEKKHLEYLEKLLGFLNKYRGISQESILVQNDLCRLFSELQAAYNKDFQ